MKRTLFVTTASAILCLAAGHAQASAKAPSCAQDPAGCPTADPDARAEALLARLDDDEKERLIVSAFWTQSAGVIRGVPEKGFPALGETDSTVGVFRWLTPTPYVSLPSATGMAASWNPALVGDAYAMVAREARTAGLGVLLGPGVNLVRDLRSGRTYEYFGEDPLLSGMSAAAAVRGIQREHVVATIKHFAMNDQESGRHGANALIGEAAMRESDLLAFELAMQAQPGAVMCSYNLVNGVYACMNRYLLTDVLKSEWGFKGWVMTDWGAATDPVRSALAGLDQYSAGVTVDGRPNPMIPREADFGVPLAKAIAGGAVPAARRDDMVRRVLRSAYAVGVVDHPPVKGPLQAEADIAVARRIESEGIVLLRNEGLLPLSATTRSIAIIGGHADTSVLTKITTLPGEARYPFGPPPPFLTGEAVPPAKSETPPAPLTRPTLWAASSPLRAMQAIAPRADIRFNDGTNPTAAAELARTSEVAIVFALQDTNEGEDLRSLRLSPDQERLIDAVAGANHNVVVVLENGTAVTMPWAGKVRGIVAAWFPGSGGGEAIADVLTGRVNPSGKLPISFPISERQQPRTNIPGQPALGSGDNQITTMNGGAQQTVDVDYRIEGADVGYKWFRRGHRAVAYPFGHGLSYTRFSYSRPQVSHIASGIRVSFTVRNIGKVQGDEVAQVYLAKPFRLAGFDRISLRPGEERRLNIAVDKRLLSNWDVIHKRWQSIPDRPSFLVGSSSKDIRLRAHSMSWQGHAATP